jgi:hypothetical protein
MARNTRPFAVKGINIVSPKGKASWCKVNVPDTMFNDKGILSTGLICDPKDPPVQAFIERLEELRDLALAETVETLGAKTKGIKARDVYTDEIVNGEETGNIIFKFALKDIETRTAEGRQDSIMVADAKRNKIDKVPNVGNGSVIRCASYANPYYMANTKEVGISLIWSKMQLIELVEFSGGGGDFDEEEGYSSSAKVKEAVKEEDDF